MADFTKGYESTAPENANTEFMPSDDEFRDIGSTAKAYKAKFKGLPERVSDDGGPMKD